MAKAVVLAILALFLTACGGTSATAYEGAYLDRPYVVPPITLTDTADVPVALANSEARLTLVFFGYTKCPDVCQVVMSTIASAVARLDKAQQKQVDVVFVTTDPARDTGPVLRDYLDRFNPRFIGLTGPLPQIVDLAKPLAIFVQKGEVLSSGGYEVDHTSAVLGLQSGKARIVWTTRISPAQMSADILKLLKES